MARFVYVDETGADGWRSKDHPLLRVIAVLVPEQAVMPLQWEMRALACEHLGFMPESFEFHGCELWAGTGPWSNHTCEDRIVAYEALIGLIDVFDLGVAHSAIDKVKLHNSYAGEADQNAYRLGLQFLLEKVDRYADGHLQIVIADEAKEHELRATKMVADLQRLGYGEVPGRSLESIIDTLHFVRSHDSSGVQMADLVAYALQRSRSRRDSHPAAMAAMERMSTVIDRRTRTWREPWPSA